MSKSATPNAPTIEGDKSLRRSSQESLNMCSHRLAYHPSNSFTCVLRSIRLSFRFTVPENLPTTPCEARESEPNHEHLNLKNASFPPFALCLSDTVSLLVFWKDNRCLTCALSLLNPTCASLRILLTASKFLI